MTVQLKEHYGSFKKFQELREKARKESLRSGVPVNEEKVLYDYTK